MSAAGTMRVSRTGTLISRSAHSSSKHRRRLALIAAAGLTAALATAPAAAASTGSASAGTAPQAASGLVPVGKVPVLPRGSRAIGPVAPSAQVIAAVAMKLPDEQAVTAFIDNASNPLSKQYHHYLAKGQFARRFGPRKSAVAAVERQLRSDGLSVTGVSANRLLVTFKGTAAQVDAAFHTTLQRVSLASGAIGRATTSAVRLPAAVAADVEAVVGLNQLVHERDWLKLPDKARAHGRTKAAAVPNTANGGPVACRAALAQQQFGALTDQQIATSYGLEPLYSAGDHAAGQTVDIFELEPFALSDIATFDKCYFGASHTSQITDTLVDGGPGTGPGSGEAALDIENVSAFAPGADIHVFSGPNMNGEFGSLDTWNQIAMADDARQVSTSWGLCETTLQQGSPGTQQVENEIFQQTAAQGQTIFAAAGDDGSDDCANQGSTPVAPDLSVDDPGSQPYVTSVGGTTITDATEPPAQTVWNNGNSGGGGGGGISETWAMPPWQSSVAVPQTTATQACSNDPSGTADYFHLQGIGTTLPGGTACREVPDVSALADPQTGITIFQGGEWFPIGGTSSSAPMWAAMLAEANASSGCSGLPLGAGFATPLLYQVASSSAANYADAFSDIKIGNNDSLGVGGAVDWPATAGFDLASGLGTPRMTDADGNPGLAAQLCAAAAGTGVPARPQVSGLTQLTGNTGIAGGGTLRIDGANFGGTQGQVYFGRTDAQVVSWTSTSITVDIPAYAPPPGTAAGVAGRADVTVVTAGSPNQSSAPNAAAVYEYTADSSGGPVVDYVSAPAGSPGGGNTVDIVGAGLTGATAVHFGDVAATTFTVLSANELQVTVPPSDGTCAVPAAQGMCAVAVTVTTPAGTSSGPPILPAYTGPVVFSPSGTYTAPAGCDCEIIQAPEEYDYASAPTITSVSPQYASENGTSSEVITGTGFNLLTFEWVNVGPAGQGFSQDFSIEGVTPTQLVIQIPPANITTEPTSSPISVQSADQLSNVSSFDYAGIPTLTKLSKHVAAQADPGNLTVTGNGLSDVSSVVFQLQGDLDFLSSTSTTISAQSRTSLTVAIPQGFTFPADVLLCTVTGCTAPDPSKDTFTLAYPGRPVVSSSSPASGPAHGGTVVEIHGALDSELTAVHFGKLSAIILQEPELTASGPILVAAPAGVAGTKVSITISTIGGTIASPPAPTSAANPKAVFSYRKSSPSAPRHASARAGVRDAAISWRPPADNGGSPVTGYVITATAKGHKPVTTRLPAGVSMVTLALQADVSWTIKVQAVNKLGRGLPAFAGPVRPRS